MKSQENSIVFRIFLLVGFIFLFLANKTYSQSAFKLHKRALVVDTHNDILEKCMQYKFSFDQDLRGKTHSDLRRFNEGGIDVQVFSIWCDGKQVNPYLFARLEIDTLLATAARNPASMAVVKNSQELKRAVRAKKLAAMIGVEGGHMIENDLNKLDTLYNLGVRYMTLTWNNSTSWASSAMEETTDSLLHQPKGLNALGGMVVRKMNQLGIMVDLSHAGEKTFWDAIRLTTRPVIASHSCAYSLCPVFRNLKDDQIRAVGKNGGVICVNFFSGFLDSNYNKQPKSQKPARATLSLLIDHIDYMVKLAGIDHVGLGSDFDGISSPPRQLDDVTNMPLITQALGARGYSKKSIGKILGGNFLRVLKANEP